MMTGPIDMSGEKINMPPTTPQNTMSDRDPIENADQPPEVDIHDDSKRLPPPGAAAHRVIEFLSWYGDGAIFAADQEVLNPPLYSRDLAALASLALAEP